MDLALTYSPCPHSSELFRTYSDADHASELDSRKSTGGFVVMVGTGAVSWSSKLQSIVGLSSTEAEYVAENEAGKEMDEEFIDRDWVHSSRTIHPLHGQQLCHLSCQESHTPQQDEACGFEASLAERCGGVWLSIPCSPVYS